MAIKAQWEVELHCKCPGCSRYIDLLDDADFFEHHRGLQVGEHETHASTDVEVVCTNCGHEFQADFEY